MTEFTLHVWGPIGSLATFDPDCLAAMWYLGLVASNQTTVVTSSNTWIDRKTCQLPALIHKDKVVGGLSAIFRYLKKLDSKYDIDTEEQKDNSLALASYIQTHLSSLSLYHIYLQKTNFELVTRPLISKLLPFPMQYNSSLKQRELANIRCIEAGLNLDLDEKQSEDEKFSLGSIQDRLEKERDARQQSFNDAKEDMKALTYAKRTYTVVADAISRLNASGACSTADVMLLAHLTVQMSSEYPMPLFKSLIEESFPQILEYYNRLEPLLVQLTIETRDAKGREVPSLFNSALDTLGL